MVKRKKICYCLPNHEKIWGLEFEENCQLIYSFNWDISLLILHNFAVLM